MGKNGAAMREAKIDRKITMTERELIAHDKVVVENYRDRVLDDVKNKADEIYKKREQEIIREAVAEWERREQAFMQNHPVDNAVSCLSLLLATTARVLIEHFGWKPIPQDGNYDGRNRLVQYCKYVEQEIDKITADPEKADIIAYCEETFQLYGVRFTAPEK